MENINSIKASPAFILWADKTLGYATTEQTRNVLRNANKVDLIKLWTAWFTKSSDIPTELMYNNCHKSMECCEMCGISGLQKICNLCKIKKSAAHIIATNLKRS